ncbi:hypothetical protein EVAR_93847_1 [Eumeta japonica]|uniref:Uncharacterized protein n=1 Tax=Eumeta variegata TaxID=151549 RepID=A0A4C1TX35_EUMVA|nr:hypothetical protein EVAR_93847_1 [Eumeta japonica]
MPFVWKKTLSTIERRQCEDRNPTHHSDSGDQRIRKSRKTHVINLKVYELQTCAGQVPRFYRPRAKLSVFGINDVDPASAGTTENAFT